VIFRAVLLRPVDIDCRTDDAAGVESCIGPDDTRENWREAVAELGTSMTEGALSDRDNDARLNPVWGVGDGLW
jgi:hypothetical protein